MEEEAYRRKGVAGMIALTGDIEGRIILDLEPQTAVKVASHYAGAELPESDGLVKETIFELANQVVGNAISALNDQGFHFRVHPPLLLTAQVGDKTNEDTEALMICFETSLGNVFMNVALRYNKREWRITPPSEPKPSSVRRTGALFAGRRTHPPDRSLVRAAIPADVEVEPAVEHREFVALAAPVRALFAARWLRWSFRAHALMRP